MVRNIVLLSHGTLAEGVYKAAGMICGDLQNVHYLCLEEKMGIEAFKDKLKMLIESLDDSSEIVLLADIKGGSPYTAAIDIFLNRGQINELKLFGGLNLPLLLTTLFKDKDLNDDGVLEIIDEARQSISIFQLEEEEEDTL